MKIAKKIFAVLLLATVIITATVIPCFAWEWNSGYSRYYYEPVFRVKSSLVSNYNLRAANSGNNFTSKGDINFLFNPNGNEGLTEARITNFPLAIDASTVGTQGDNFSKLSVLSAKTVWTNTDPDFLQNLQKNFLKYTGGRFDPNSPLSNLNETYNVPESGYYQFIGAYAPSYLEYSYTYSDLNTIRYFYTNYEDTTTYYDFLLGDLQYLSYYLGTAPSSTVKLTDVYNVLGYIEYRTTSGHTYVIDIREALDSRNISLPTTNYDGYYGTTCSFGTVIKMLLDDKKDFDSRFPIAVKGLEIVTKNKSCGTRQYRLGAIYDVTTEYGEVSQFNRSSYATSINEYKTDVDTPSNIDLGSITSFLSSGVSNFLGISIAPGITLGGILATVLCISLFIAYLKIFAGG